ncbi:MAG: hypothetical protein Q9M32_01300 [Sulfurimonas sp.]|nr:hypothetical protein [Sulfurimonas sp.]MDQ7062563.1 hypothetical protein [Sulfurimonas sp.]
MYTNYSEVPFYQKQWFFWIMFFTLNPIAIIILLVKDVYYERGGKLQNFGIANKIFIIILTIGFYLQYLGY